MAGIPRKTTLKQAAKGSAVQTLPDDVLTDLKHVMEHLKNGDEPISRADFRTIMHNFGHYSIRQKEFEEELRKHGFDTKQQTFTESEIISLITSLWYEDDSCKFLN